MRRRADALHFREHRVRLCGRCRCAVLHHRTDAAAIHGPGGGGGKNKGDAPFSKRVQRVFPFALELAGREELRGPSGSGDIVRSEHLLLALIEDDDSGAVAALQRLDVDVDELRAEIRADAERGTGEAELVAGRGTRTTPRRR